MRLSREHYILVRVEMGITQMQHRGAFLFINLISFCNLAEFWKEKKNIVFLNNFITFSPDTDPSHSFPSNPKFSIPRVPYESTTTQLFPLFLNFHNFQVLKFLICSKNFNIFPTSLLFSLKPILLFPTPTPPL